MIMQLIMILSCVLQDWSYFYASSVLLVVIVNTVLLKYCYCVNLCCRIYLFSICCTFCYSYFPCSSPVKMFGIKLIAWHCICRPSCGICLKSMQEVLNLIDDIRWYKYCILELVLAYIYLKLKSTSYKSHTIKNSDVELVCFFLEMCRAINRMLFLKDELEWWLL